MVRDANPNRVVQLKREAFNMQFRRYSMLASASLWVGTVFVAAAPALGDGHFETQPAANPLQEQVFAAERAFARSMADRDLDAFAGFVADEAVFFGGSTTLRGKPQVVSAWSGFFEGSTAPFSWEPDRVEVLESGTLALSTGLVRDPEGKVIARFNSIWRLEAPGVWRVIFDKGSPPSAAEKQ